MNGWKGRLNVIVTCYPHMHGLTRLVHVIFKIFYYIWSYGVYLVSYRYYKMNKDLVKNNRHLTKRVIKQTSGPIITLNISETSITSITKQMKQKASTKISKIAKGRVTKQRVHWYIITSEHEASVGGWQLNVQPAGVSTLVNLDKVFYRHPAAAPKRTRGAPFVSPHSWHFMKSLHRMNSLFNYLPLTLRVTTRRLSRCMSAHFRY